MATFVLVHGAWHGGWCWKKLTPLLRDAGHHVFTPTLTGLGERAHLLGPGIDLNTHTSDIVAVLSYEDLRDVILVGHSYGGMVVTGAAEQAAERLAHLVYLDAFVPEDGQCVRDLLDAEAWDMYAQNTRTKGDGWRAPPPPLERYGIRAPEDLEWMGPRMGDHPFPCLTQPVRLGNPQARALPRTYIACTVDQRPPFAAAAERARGASGWRCYDIVTGHDAMVTEPRRLADILLEFAR